MLSPGQANRRYMVARTPAIANRRKLRWGRVRLGVGLYLLGMAALIPVLFAGLPAWNLWTMLSSMAIFGGLGAWQSTKAVTQLRIAKTERKALEAAKPAELPEARVVTDHL